MIVMCILADDYIVIKVILICDCSLGLKNSDMIALSLLIMCLLNANIVDPRHTYSLVKTHCKV